MGSRGRSLNSLRAAIRWASVKVALAQINTTVGDIQGNEAKILAACADVKRKLSRDQNLVPDPRS